VRRRDQVFEAHAWVEYGGEVLGDRIERVREFVQIADARDGQFR
ncbi:MAG: lasso peptide biosynthesis protein, partial [Chloroflexi bacterium]|nr:lasso peptide biosynthesis protein [Chloroflexota bacterium]